MSLISYLTTIRFDFGALAGLKDDLRELGIKAPLIVADAGIARVGLVDRLKGLLPGGQDVPVFTDTPTNPTEAAVLAALELYRSNGCDGLIAIGGGSPSIWPRAWLFCQAMRDLWNNMRPSWAASRRSTRRSLR